MKWLACLGLIGCSQPGDFDYQFSGGDDGGLYDASMGVDVLASADTGVDVPDSEIRVDMLTGRWAVDRSATTVACSVDSYHDEWLVTLDGLEVAIGVVTSDWPVAAYQGRLDGSTLTLHGCGGGLVNGYNQVVCTDLSLTIQNGELVGTELSSQQGCSMATRDVKGVRE